MDIPKKLRIQLKITTKLLRMLPMNTIRKSCSDRGFPTMENIQKNNIAKAREYRMISVKDLTINTNTSS